MTKKEKTKWRVLDQKKKWRVKPGHAALTEKKDTQLTAVLQTAKIHGWVLFYSVAVKHVNMQTVEAYI